MVLSIPNWSYSVYYLKEMAIALKQSGFYSIFVNAKCIWDVFDFWKN